MYVFLTKERNDLDGPGDKCEFIPIGEARALLKDLHTVKKLIDPRQQVPITYKGGTLT